LIFTSLEDKGEEPEIERTKSSLFSPVDNLLFSARESFRFPEIFLSTLYAKARRFTGRSDLIILSKNIAGKLNLGITLTSYDTLVDEDLQETELKNKL